MRTGGKIALGAGALVIAGVVGAGAWFRIPEVAQVFTGQAAKLLCDGVFVGNRTEAAVRRQDLTRLRSPGKELSLARLEVNHADKTVTGSLFGLKKRTAVWRPGIGCTAAEGLTPTQLRAQGSGVETRLARPDPSKLWPEGDATLVGAPHAGVDAAKLERALDFAFTDPSADRPSGSRAVVIVHRGRIVAERYAAGFSKDHAHLSNSIAKSVTSALVGILVGQGRLDLDAPAPVPEWRGKDDPRGKITLEHLMRMSSGLKFEEDYQKVKSDITLSHAHGKAANYAASLPLEVPPGTRWEYSTGTSNILGRIVREAATPAGARDFSEGFAFPRRALFERIGMRSGVLEPDASGGFIGGSFFYATARDYARLGQLYLQDGTWNGERILPEGWVAYTTRMTSNGKPKLGYGAQFWLNSNPRVEDRRWPELPPDAYSMIGHQGQWVMIIPSRELVVARFALQEYDDWKFQDFAVRVLDAVAEAKSQ